MQSRRSAGKKLRALVRLILEHQHRDAKALERQKKQQQQPAQAEASHPLAKLARAVPPSAVGAGGKPLSGRFTLWHCNLQPWRHWLNVQTMWASDQGFRTGLRTADVQAYLQLAGIAANERKTIFALLQECEQEALTVYAEHWQSDEREREEERAQEQKREKLRNR